MAKRRQKKPTRIIHLSVGPLPARISDRFTGYPLVFSDASKLRQGGLAAVLFLDENSEPLITTQSVPAAGSNALELEAALLGLAIAKTHCPDQAFVLFSDNQDAVARLNRAKHEGLAQDSLLAALPEAHLLAETLSAANIHWIPGHASCRGNALADAHARMAAA